MCAQNLVPYVFMNIIQLILTIYNICKIWSSNCGHHQKSLVPHHLKLWHMWIN